MDVLAELFPVLMDADGEQIAHGSCPDACDLRPRMGFGTLELKCLLHLATVLRAEIARQQPQQLLKCFRPLHDCFTFGIRFFACAIRRALSIRRASAWAT